MKQLILGGTRCGKSEYAEGEAAASGLVVRYIATAVDPVEDLAFQARIERHRQRRPDSWLLVEEALELPALLRHASPNECLLVDCLTLWLTNVMMLEDAEAQEHYVDGLIEALQETPARVLLISNEISLGVVPMGDFTRQFVDTLGLLHQRLAALSDQVTLVVAGLPLPLKPGR